MYCNGRLHPAKRSEPYVLVSSTCYIPVPRHWSWPPIFLLQLWHPLQNYGWPLISHLCIHFYNPVTVVEVSVSTNARRRRRKTLAAIRFLCQSATIVSCKSGFIVTYNRRNTTNYWNLISACISEQWGASFKLGPWSRALTWKFIWYTCVLTVRKNWRQAQGGHVTPHRKALNPAPSSCEAAVLTTDN